MPRQWLNAVYGVVLLALAGSGPLQGQEDGQPREAAPAKVGSLSTSVTQAQTGPAGDEKLDRATVERMIQEAIAVEAAKRQVPSVVPHGRDFGLQATWDHGFVAQTADEAFRFHMGGRLEFDNTWFTQDSFLLLGNSNTSRLNDGSMFRRARLRADGLLWGYIDFVTEVNFANIQEVKNTSNQETQIGSVGLTDFYMTFRELPLAGNVRVGHFRPPVGLDRYSGSVTLNYMERSTLFDAFLAPTNFQNGILVFDSYLDDRVTLAGAFTRTGTGATQSFGFIAADGKYAGSGRVTGLPIYAEEGRQLLHLGVGYQHQTLVDHSFSASSRPLLRAGSGTNPDTPSVLATGTYYSPQGTDILDLEAASVCGPLSFSAEYALLRATELFNDYDGFAFSGPRGDVLYQAFYVEAGCFLTPDDYRRYDKKTGTWGRTLPQDHAVVEWNKQTGWNGGLGAVQLVARFTYLDLLEGDPVLSSTSGGALAGKQTDITLGVNWYLNSQVWIMVNYVWTHIDSVDSTASGNFQGLGTRIHIDF